MPADFLVDVSRVFSTKRQMLSCHASQRNWLLRQHGIDEYLEMQARWGASRGADIRVAQAEGFRQYRGHPYPHDDLLLRLLNQALKKSQWLELPSQAAGLEASASTDISNDALTPPDGADRPKYLN